MLDRVQKLTVGIPAYNEEANIKNLLVSILSQKQDGFELAELIVVSDGSTDNTDIIVRGVADKRLKLLIHPKRQGIASSQNTIVQNSTGDILVLLNADVLPASENFLIEITAPLRSDESVDLVGADVVAADPESFFESVLAYSHRFKTHIYRRIRGGDNVYLCHGRARAFRKRLYQKIRWPDQFSEDGFSYLFAKKHGSGFVYRESAKVIFRSPKTLSDHIGQSSRFWLGKRGLEKYFDKDFVKAEFRISPLDFMKAFAVYSVRDPLRMLIYGVVALAIAGKPAGKSQRGYSKYNVATSSKSLD